MDDVFVWDGYERLRLLDKIGLGGIGAGVSYLTNALRRLGSVIAKYTMETGTRQWSTSAAAIQDIVDPVWGPGHGWEENLHHHDFLTLVNDLLYVHTDGVDKEVFLRAVAETFEENLVAVLSSGKLKLGSAGAIPVYNGLDKFSRAGLAGGHQKTGEDRVGEG